MVLVTAGVALVAVVARRWAAFATTGLAMALLLVAVLPRTFGDGYQPAGADGPELRVMSANLKLGKADPEAVVQLVQENGIDVLALQELTPSAAIELDAAGLGNLLPHSVGDPAESSHGSAIVARIPLRERPGAEPLGYPFAMPTATAEPSDAAGVDVSSVHVVPPTGGSAVTTWQAALEALPSAAESGRPTMLIGDFNATLDHREFREVIERGYVDAGDATGQGLRFTWPRKLTRPGVTIDHILIDERIGVAGYDVHDLPGSDHRAISAILRLPGG